MLGKILTFATFTKTHTDDLAATVTAGAFWLLAQMDGMPDLLTKAVENSVFAALVIFFVWTTWRREAVLNERISALEQHGPLLLERTVTALEKHSEATNGLRMAIEAMERTMQSSKRG